MLITTAEFCQTYKVSRVTIWRFRRRYRDFPKPMGINGFNLRWDAGEVADWFRRRTVAGQGSS